MGLAQEAMKSVLESLTRELEKEPISPERVAALSKAIMALNSINPLTQI